MYAVYFTFASGGACSHLPTRDKDYFQGVTALCHFWKKSKDQTETIQSLTFSFKNRGVTKKSAVNGYDVICSDHIIFWGLIIECFTSKTH